MGRVVNDAQAIADLLEIHHFIGVERESPAAADRFLDELLQKLELYSESPLIGLARPDLAEEVRSFTFKRTYVVIYRPLADGIDVLRVFHGKRDYPSLF